MSKIHKELGVDPKDYTHVSSTDKTTTLKHKRGHLITIAHSVLKPSTQAMLKALSKIPQENATSTQAQESEDQHQYGKIIQKADGGRVPIPDSGQSSQSDRQNNLSEASKVETTGSDKSQAATASDPSQVWSNIKNGWAKGGKIESKGISTQGRDIRYGADMYKGGKKQALEFAKDEARGRAEEERHIKPKLAEGGHVNSPGGPVDANFAYDHGLPCRNPACKSNGRPHPNCRCYSFAEGGKVQHVCGMNLGHYPDCEHYTAPRQKMAEGGQAVPYGMRESDIPDEHQTEQELDKYEAQNPSRLEQSNSDRMEAKTPSPMMQPGMPGYDEQHEPINDTEEPPTGSEEQTNPEMYQKIHNGDQYGRMPAEASQAEAQAPNPDEAQPTSDTVDMGQQPSPTAQLQPVDHAAEIMQETNAFRQDLLDGHIKPKTYNDLMYHNRDGSEKSTLGKIGSIFGLLLSSVGAGLTHGPNMSMQMMDNAIKNDLESQIKSKENAQNFYRLNQQMLLNDANVKSTLANADMTDAQRAAVQQGVDMKAAALTYNQMGSAAVHSIIDKVNKLPEGPEKQKAAQVALMVAQAAETNGAKAAAIAAAGINGLSMYGMNPSQSGGDNAEQKFQNDMQARENAGDKPGADSIRERHIPGVPGLASAPVSEEMRNKFRDMDILDSKVKDVLSFAQQNRGSIDPRVLSQARQKAEELTSFYNKSVDSLGLSKGRLGWLEEQIKKNPTSLIQQLLGNNSTLREIRDSNATRGLQLKKDLGFPVQVPKNTGEQLQESVSKSGKPMVFRNGRWEYK